MALWETLEDQKSWNWLTPRDLSAPAARELTEASIQAVAEIPRGFLIASIENAMRELVCLGLGYSVNLEKQCSRPSEAWHLRQLQAVSIEVCSALESEKSSVSLVCRIHACIRRLVPPAAEKVKTILNRRRKEARKNDLHDNEAFKASQAAGKLFKTQRTIGKCQVLDMKLMCDSDTVVEMLPTLEPVRLLRFFWGAFPEPSALQKENRRRGFSLYEPLTEEDFWRAESALGAPRPPSSGDSLVAEVQLLSGFGGTMMVSTGRLTHACPILRCASRLQAPEMLADTTAHLLAALGAESKLAWLAAPSSSLAKKCDPRIAVSGIQRRELDHSISTTDLGVVPGAAASVSPASIGSVDSLSQDSDLDLGSDDERECPLGAASTGGNFFVSAKATHPAAFKLTAVGGTKPTFRCFTAPAAGVVEQAPVKRAAPQLSSIQKRVHLGVARK